MTIKRNKILYTIVCISLLTTILFCGACNRQYSPRNDEYFFDSMERLNSLIFGMYRGTTETGGVYHILDLYSYSTPEYVNGKSSKDFSFSYNIPNRYGSFGNSSYISADEINTKKNNVTVTYKNNTLSFYNRSFTVDGQTFYDYPWKSRILTNELLNKQSISADVTKSADALQKYFSEVYPATKVLGEMQNIRCEIVYTFSAPMDYLQFSEFVSEQNNKSDILKIKHALVKTGNNGSDVLLRVAGGGSIPQAKIHLEFLKDENHKQSSELLLSSDLFGIDLDFDAILNYLENNPISVVGFVCETNLPQEESPTIHSENVLIKRAQFH